VFADVTAKAGVGYKGHSCATWLDVDGDGDLDLFLCNIGKFTIDTIKEADYFFKGVAPRSTGAADAKNGGEGCILTRTTATHVHRRDPGVGITAVEWNGDVAWLYDPTATPTSTSRTCSGRTTSTGTRATERSRT
jgi:hypothetical protein